MSKCIIIGAGAAGLMCAVCASEKGNEVILIEKNEKIGKKLLITGKGRCNITNSGEIEDIINNTPGNGNFLYSALYTFSNSDIIEFFNNNGLETKVERGGRIFPVSDKAFDVIRVFENLIRKHKIKLLLNTTVKDILINNNEVYGVLLNNKKKVECDKIVVATGGVSYPLTGSTGDGHRFATKVGHTITDLKPSLVPIETKEEWVKDLQGLSLRNVEIKVTSSKKKLYTDFGEMIFTHYGVSGPLILSSSRHIIGFENKDVKFTIDLKPSLDYEKLEKRLLRDFDKNLNRQLKNSLDEILPQKMIPVFVKLSGIDENKIVNQITKEERKRLIELFKNFEFSFKKFRPIKEAIITAGGVNIDEVNPSTMESKIVKNLYIVGELLDLDAYTGGYNLTIAFSTGYLAGQNC